MLLGNLTCCVYLALFFQTVQYLYFDLVRIKCVLLFRPTKFNFQPLFDSTAQCVLVVLWGLALTARMICGSSRSPWVCWYSSSRASSAPPNTRLPLSQMPFAVSEQPLKSGSIHSVISLGVLRYHLRFGSSSCSISIESSWPADLDYLSFRSIPRRWVILSDMV